ncbi:MAG: RIO1 family regulatory kinase/ATPase [Steroidobacteraceae bacterium]
MGLIHGDLSEFNVLVGRDGPVIHRPTPGGECRRQQWGARHATARCK